MVLTLVFTFHVKISSAKCHGQTIKQMEGSISQAPVVVELMVLSDADCL